MKYLTKIIFALALVFSVSFLSSCEKEVIEPVAEVAEDIELDDKVSDERFLELLDVAEEKAMEKGDRQMQWAFDGEFELTYNDTVTIGVGGAIYNHTTDEWLSGGAAGNAQIPPAVFEALENSLPGHVRVQVQQSWFFLRQITITFLDQGNEVINGLYNANNGDYLFLGLNGANGTIGNTACGLITMGAITGRLSADQLALNNGNFGMGFIAGCGPILLGANAGFTYEGVRIP